MNALSGREKDYLCVDRYMRDAVGARALASALELGLIDRLRDGPCSLSELGAHARIDGRAVVLLSGLLAAGGVVEDTGGRVRLTEAFRNALQFRDLMEAKLAFAAAVAPDFLDLFTLLLTNPAGFFEQAKLFKLFSYDRCFESTPENLAATANWMRFTTALTRYESAACLANHDFSPFRRMLDVGGNSGEFALRICQEHPRLSATVYDLPVVCELGGAHVAGEAEAARIDFKSAGPSDAALPHGYDLVTFKSMLHDWPHAHMRRFLARAHGALLPGGRVLIFERTWIETDSEQVSYSMIPILLFFRSYRLASEYKDPLSAAGFSDIEVTMVNLDTPFMLLTATKRA
jgi:hypothetical protein